MRKPVSRPAIQDRQAVPVLLKAFHGDTIKVAKHLNRCERFVTLWDARSRAGRGFKNKPGCGPKRTVGPAGITAAKRMATNKIEKSAAKIAERLHEVGHTEHQVHPTTVLRWLKSGRVPVLYLPMVRYHRLTPVHKQKRVVWAAENAGQDWENVLFTDSHIYQIGGTTGRKRQQRVTARKTRETTGHGLKLHVYAGMSARGTTDLHFVTGTTGVHFTSPQTGQTCRGVGAQEYCSVIRENLIPGGRRLFDKHGFTVYQDGARAHTARLTRACWAEYPGNPVLQASPLSPDLNLIENLWEILDRKLDGRSFSSIKALKAAARAAWRSIPVATCQQLVDGMPLRLQKVIDRQGGHIERNIYS